MQNAHKTRRDNAGCMQMYAKHVYEPGLRLALPYRNTV